MIFSCKEKQRNKNIKNLYKKEIISNVWETYYDFSSNEEIRRIKLIKFKERKFVGVLTSFNKIYEDWNVAPCGNDNFNHSYGEYELYDKDKIMISVDSITHSGEEKRPTEYKNREETDYSISKKGDTIILTKID
jgi:hypothetical protein